MSLMVEDPNTGQRIELRSDNTMVLLFVGDGELDHIAVRIDDDHGMLCYDPQLIQLAIASRQFPVMAFPFRPQFAVERRAAQEVPDFERLLDDGSAQ